MNWEPWTGCYPQSIGCTYCYFYGKYSKRYGQNQIVKTPDFNKPVALQKNNQPKIASGKIVATCFGTDFFLPEADPWRKDAWKMIRQRPDLDFLILTKRIDRFEVSLPADWGEGYANVNLGVSVENQALADLRLPQFLSFPIKRRFVSCTPLLGPIDLTAYIDQIDHVSVGGETGKEARECNLDWILALRQQCLDHEKTFWFKNTGSRFRCDGVLQKVNPYKQSSLAKSMNLNLLGETPLF